MIYIEQQNKAIDICMQKSEDALTGTCSKIVIKGQALGLFVIGFSSV
jgi:hypothetical protein